MACSTGPGSFPASPPQESESAEEGLWLGTYSSAQSFAGPHPGIRRRLCQARPRPGVPVFTNVIRERENLREGTPAGAGVQLAYLCRKA